MGAILSVKRYKEPTSESVLDPKVEELEKEVEKQKEMKITYRKRMEQSQEYLRHCLEIAQQHGFLDLILQNKHSSSSSSSTLQNQSLPSSSSSVISQHSELASLIDMAKLNGWYISPDEIELQGTIGQRSTANIHNGTWRGLDVAVKCLRQDFFESNDKAVSFFAQELDTLARQRHPFVLHLMGACMDPPHHAWVVTEIFDTTLEEWLHGKGKRQTRDRALPVPPLTERLRLALEIAQAMQYLHEQRPKVIHRDLKPSNIFLDHSLHARVADFGHARFLNDQEMALSGETGTYVYMAPEVIRCEPYNEKCDVYSFGIILNQLLTIEYPYIQLAYGPAKIAMEVVDSNLRPRLVDQSEQLDEIIRLVCLSWNGDPSLRPPFATITTVLKTQLENLLSEF